MTSYDDIWTEFLTNCKTEDINLPQAQSKIYDAIHSVVRMFNNRLQESVVCDDTTETIDYDLTDTQLLIISHYLRLQFLKNQLTFFTTCYQPFEKEIGFKNFQSQVKAMEKAVEDEKKEIEDAIKNSATDIM